jgi:hypothetical protein
MYTDNDLRQDFGWYTGSYIGTYIKCMHVDDNDSLYYYGDENDPDEVLEFTIMNRYNSIIATPLKIPHYNSVGKRSEKKLRMALDCFLVNVDVIDFLEVKDKIYGSKKVSEIMLAIEKHVNDR